MERFNVNTGTWRSLSQAEKRQKFTGQKQFLRRRWHCFYLLIHLFLLLSGQHRTSTSTWTHRSNPNNELRYSTLMTVTLHLLNKQHREPDSLLHAAIKHVFRVSEHGHWRQELLPHSRSSSSSIQYKLSEVCWCCWLIITCMSSFSLVTVITGYMEQLHFLRVCAGIISVH